MTRTDELTDRVKALALEAGFARVGVAPAAETPHGERLDEWLARGWHAGMGYMARNVEKRKRPDLLERTTETMLEQLFGGSACPPDFPDFVRPRGAENTGRKERRRKRKQDRKNRRR